MMLLDRFENVKKVWGLVLPTVPLPENETVLGWLAVYLDSEIEGALLRIPHRLRQGKLGQAGAPPAEIYKLVSSFLYEMKKSRRLKEQREEALRERREQKDLSSYDGRGNQ
jgi:hypothetical protein